MMLAVPPRAMMLAALVAFATAAGPRSAAAQRGETRNFVLRYEPGSETRNGYADAQLEMRYYFAACPQVNLVIQSSPTVKMLVGAHRYWYRGKLLQVPPTISPPPATRPSVRGTIRGNGIAKEITSNYVTPTAGCFNLGVQVGDASAFWPAGTPDAEKVRILNQFGFDHQQTLGPLTNAAVENYFREQLAAATRDSAQRAQTARADSLRRAREAANTERLAQARRDSIARAQSSTSSTSGAAGSSTTSRGNASTGTTAGGTTAGGTTTGGTTATTGTTGTSAADREAARAQAEREQRERDAEHARVSEANRREKAIQDSIATEQLAQATAQGVMAAAQLLGMFFEGLEGTGLLLGASYSAPYFEGDRGLVGVTVSGYMDGFMLPFLELHYVMEGPDLGTEKTSMAATLGSVIPKTGFSLPSGIPLLGGQYKLHAGITHLTTTESFREFNYIERSRNLLLLGLTHFGGASNLVTRLDMTIYGGTPVWGVALGKAF